MSQTKTRRTLDEIIRFTSSIGESAIFTGNIVTDDNIVVRGTVIGNSQIDGIIVVEAHGKWLGNLSAKALIINGHVEGNITAQIKIEIQNNAKIIGDLISPKIAIESGAIHDGSIHMDDKTQLTTFEEKRKKD